jgi:hypothetical protein
LNDNDSRHAKLLQDISFLLFYGLPHKIAEIYIHTYVHEQAKPRLQNNEPQMQIFEVLSMPMKKSIPICHILSTYPVLSSSSKIGQSKQSDQADEC